MMKKIIAAFDGLHYSESTQEYAIHLARSENAHLVGVFLEDYAFTNEKIYELADKENVSEQRLRQIEEEDDLTRHRSVSNFEKACSVSRVEYSVHHDKKTPLRELRLESIFADLLVIRGSEALGKDPEKKPSRLIRGLLEDAECPLLLVPAVYTAIEKIVLLYDGKANAVNAIKMFSYVLPKLKNTEIEVIAINPPDSSLHLPENRLMKELMKRHFSQVKYNVSLGWPENEILSRLKGLQKNCLVVLGGSKRNLVAQWCTESMGEILLQGVNLPLFVTK